MKQRGKREQSFQPPPEGRRGRWGWTGFGNKTLWDWLQLLVVPAMLALVGFLLAAAQENIQQQAEESRAQAQRDAEESRAQDEALQAYLEGMGNLLLDEGLLSSQEDDEVRTLARARTLTILGRVDGARKRSVVQFLYESELIEKDQPIVRLSGADLTDANLSGANLYDAVLYDANLTNANLTGAVLRGADLTDADLSGVLLRDADLSGVQSVTPEELEDHAYSISGATMPDGSTHPNTPVNPQHR